MVREASNLVQEEEKGSLYDELNAMFEYNMNHHSILNSVVLEDKVTSKRVAVVSAHVSNWNHILAFLVLFRNLVTVIHDNKL